MAAAICVGKVAQIAPIHLCLVSGRGFKAADGDGMRLFASGTQVVFDGGVAAFIALFFEFTPQHHSIPDAGFEAFFEKGLVRVQQGRTRLARPIARGLGLRQIFADGWTAVAGEGADLGNGQPLTFVVIDFVHFFSS